MALSHMSLYIIMISHRRLKMSMEDGRDFTAYADVYFREFGDRVSYWTTVNEANVFVLGGYDMGFLPPQRCSYSFCSRGNSSSEPYMAAHNILLAHAAVAKLYKTKYQDKQRGFIGLNIYLFGFIPCTNSTEDIIATQRANDFYYGWFLHPLVYGDYPSSMKKNAGSRIPTLSLNIMQQCLSFLLHPVV